MDIAFPLSGVTAYLTHILAKTRKKESASNED